MVINEAPDQLYYKGDVFRYSREDAYSFAYNKFETDFEVSEPGKSHQTLFKNAEGKTRSGGGKYQQKYAGRLWTKPKVISFWDYPESHSKLQEIIKNIENEIDIKIDSGWKVEIPFAEGKPPEGTVSDIDRGEGLWFDVESRKKNKFVPVNKYKGLEDSTWDPERRDHEKSPLEKAKGKQKYKAAKALGNKDVKKKRQQQKKRTKDLGAKGPDDYTPTKKIKRFREVIREVVRKTLREDGILDDPFMSQGKGWLSPDGKIIELKSASGHLGSILKMPGKFGLTDKQIERASEKYNVDKKTAALSLALERGWVRFIETHREMNIEGKRSTIQQHLAKIMKDTNYIIDEIPSHWEFKGKHPDAVEKSIKLDLEGLMRRYG